MAGNTGPGSIRPGLPQRRAAEEVLAATASREELERISAGHLSGEGQVALLLVAAAAGRLLDYERRNSTPLLHTFAVYLESELSVSATAEALFCHPNTVRYRLSRIEVLSGLNPRIDRDRSILSLALALRDVGFDAADPGLSAGGAASTPGRP